MKTIFKYIILGLFVLPFFTLSSCKKDINDINKDNPNEFNDSDPKLMITGAELANVMINEGEVARLAGIFAGHFSGYDRQYISYGQYNMTAGDFNSPWPTIYTEGIAQCRLIKAKAITAKDLPLEAVANITEANLLITASSLWGDIPNTEACNTAYTAPKFDKMADIYTYCIGLLDSAIAKVGTSSAYRAAYDGTFKWKEVAFTLKARALLHKKDYANAIIAATTGISSGNDFFANHQTESPGAWNLYYDFLDWNRGGYMSCDGSYIVSLLDSTSTSYKGNSKTNEAARFDYYFLLDNYTPIDPNMYTGVFTATSNFALASYVENEMILAESYWRTADYTKALDHLNLVRASHDATWGGYAPYVAGDFADNNALLKEILVEKYVSLFGQVEAFNDVRRTKNVIGVPPYAGTTLPGRFLYPQSEINSNPNTPKGFGLMDAVDLFK